MLLLAAVMTAGLAADAFAQKALSKKGQTVVFVTTIHCESCKKRVEDKLPFEKGVSDVVIDVAKKTIAVTYDPNKTDPAKLKESIEKLGYKAEVAKPRQDEAARKQ